MVFYRPEIVQAFALLKYFINLVRCQKATLWRHDNFDGQITALCAISENY